MTAMDTLAAVGVGAPEIPRFDDGMANVNELVRTLAEALVNEIMDAQAEDACAEGNQCNGHRERQLLMSVGRITLRIPKLRRGTYFPEGLIERYSRTDRAVVAAVAEMVTSGVSTRKVEKVTRALGVDRMSASQVSRICESLDAAAVRCVNSDAHAGLCTRGSCCSRRGVCQRGGLCGRCVSPWGRRTSGKGWRLHRWSIARRGSRKGPSSVT